MSNNDDKLLCPMKKNVKMVFSMDDVRKPVTKRLIFFGTCEQDKCMWFEKGWGCGVKQVR